MNEKIAKTLVQDFIKSGKNEDTIKFFDNENVYTVKVSKQTVLSEQLRKNEGTFVSSGPAGSPCGCCGGSGKA